jgi:hypothetical protein
MLVLVLLLLLLLKGACAITPLSTYRARIEVAGKRRPNGGVMYPRVNEVSKQVFFFFFFSHTHTHTHKKSLEDS